MDKGKEKSTKRFFAQDAYMIIVGVAFLAFIVIALLYLYKFNDGLSDRQEVWGQFGDFLGGSLNPILGFLTVIILVNTLKTQRRELRDAKKAIKTNNRLIKSQLRFMELQALENTFFKLLEDFDKNPFVMKCREPGQNINIYCGVYKIRDEDVDSPKGAEVFGSCVDGVSLGQFRYIVIDKFMSMVSLASRLDNNKIHFKLMQTTAGIRLVSAMVHHSKKLPSAYELFKKARPLLNGLHHEFAFDPDVAKDFLSKSEYRLFLLNDATNQERLERTYQIRIDKRNS